MVWPHGVRASRSAYDPGFANLTSSSSFIRADGLFDSDTFIPGQGLVNSVLQLTVPGDSEVYDEEIRLTSNSDGPFQWSAGGSIRTCRAAPRSSHILLREGAEVAVYRAREHELPKALVGSDGNYSTSKTELCERIRSARIGLDDAALKNHLRFATLTQALVDQPRYSGVATALAGQ